MAHRPSELRRLASESECYLLKVGRGSKGHCVLRLTPNALPLQRSGVRGQNQNFSFISVVE